jgi:hypothetical protein
MQQQKASTSPPTRCNAWGSVGTRAASGDNIGPLARCQNNCGRDKGQRPSLKCGGIAVAKRQQASDYALLQQRGQQPQGLMNHTGTKEM